MDDSANADTFFRFSYQGQPSGIVITSFDAFSRPAYYTNQMIPHYKEIGETELWTAEIVLGQPLDPGQVQQSGFSIVTSVGVIVPYKMQLV